MLCIITILYQGFSVFTSRKEYYPHTLIDETSAAWYNLKESHSEQFIFFRTALFVCSESDTFLKNFTIYLQIPPQAILLETISYLAISHLNLQYEYKFHILALTEKSLR